MDEIIRNNRSDLGLCIKHERESQGLSQRKLALIIGMHNSHLGRIEAGTCNTSIDTIAKIADALGVDIAFTLSKSE